MPQKLVGKPVLSGFHGLPQPQTTHGRLVGRKEKGRTVNQQPTKSEKLDERTYWLDDLYKSYTQVKLCFDLVSALGL